jgi:hypothetical protein
MSKYTDCLLPMNSNNDYSITQFNMNTAYSPNPDGIPSRLGNVRPNDASMRTFIQCPPSAMSGCFVGEENISNEESPHKCHSIKTYNISTFFNKEDDQSRVSKKFFEGGSQYNPSVVFNYDQLRGYPKINFDMPESKFNEHV